MSASSFPLPGTVESGHPCREPTLGPKRQRRYYVVTNDIPNIGREIPGYLGICGLQINIRVNEVPKTARLDTG